MKLEQALARYLELNIPDLHVFKDDLAHTAAGYPYPLLLITEIDARRKQIGTGPYDALDGSIERKWWNIERTLRFTVRSPADKQRDGNTIVHSLIEQIDGELQSLFRIGSVELPVGSDSVHIAMANHSGFHELPAITDQLPFVYQRTVSWRFQEMTSQEFEGVPPLIAVHFEMGEIQ
ncbi:MAG: hypothetical protein OEM52_07435 [bacterium]|nr:hypothetical protein [bacterium]